MTGVLRSLRDYHKQEPKKVKPAAPAAKKDSPSPRPSAKSSKPKGKSYASTPKSAAIPANRPTGRKPTGPAKRSDKEKDRSVTEKRFARAGGARPEGPVAPNNSKARAKPAAKQTTSSTSKSSGGSLTGPDRDKRVGAWKSLAKKFSFKF